MGAIAGFFGIEPQNLEEVLRTMARRGLDGNEICKLDSGGLLRARLRRPSLNSWEKALTQKGECCHLTYSGRLYNAPELRRALEGEGQRFLGNSDEELVLRAYSQWGQECLQRFNGVFAFAIWEEKARRLFLARDRIGVKPLFYRIQPGTFLFASEIKTILAFPGVRAILDEEGAAQLILLGPGRLPGSGVFQNIQELEPGCCGLYENGHLEVTRYWKLKDREHTDSFQETVEKVRYLLEDAVRRQTDTREIFGTFLSGGLDSSILSAMCAKALEARGEKLQTFSVDYQDNDLYFLPGKFQPDADGKYIQDMVAALGCEHHRTVLSPTDLIDELQAATLARDLPGMGDVDFSLLAFCKQIRPFVPMALSGECADEIFGGYPWYRDPEIRAKAGFPWAQNTAVRSSLLLHKREHAEELVMDAYRDTCQASDILPGTDAQNRRIKEMVNLNFRWFMQTLLDRNDRMSMSAGLEVRVPFCDYRIAEYLYSVPWEMKDYQGREKGLLRYAATGLLPESVRMRKKSPYPKTFDPQYEALVTERLRTELKENSPLWYLIDRREAMNILQEECPQPWYGQLMRRPQIIAYLLQMDFWLRHYQVEMHF